MSMEEKRNAVGKVLTCLLLSSKGGCTISKLEHDYKNEEGHFIPYQEFGCISALDFFRTIPGHVRLMYDGRQHLVYPVVTEKTQHVKDLVARQKTPKASSRRKCSRPSRYYPCTLARRSFVPFEVQKSVAHTLTNNPSGVSRSCVADQLQRSGTIPGTVDADNVGEFVSAMPHTAVSSGSKIYPSRSLDARPRSSQRRYDEIDGSEVVSPRDSQAQINPEQHAAAVPGGSKDAEPETCDGGKSRYLSYDVRARKTAGHSDERTGRMSSAAFIDRAVGLSYTEVARENSSCSNSAMKIERQEEEEEETLDPNCTYISDDEKSVEIIGSRMKKRLEDLIKKYPEGIWCADLVNAYSTEYKVRFDYKDYGFSSVSEFASQLKDIFHLVRFNPRGDFKLYDASLPAPQPEGRPAPPPTNAGWRDMLDDDDDVNPLPLQVESKESLGLVPPDVMAYGESVGQVKIPEVSEGPDYSNIEVYVSEVFTPSIFWIHLRKKRAKLDQFMTALHEFYEQEGDNYTIPMVVLEKGLNCVCTFQDTWHRAIIKNVKPNGDVTLMFYDYGTIQTSSAKTLRYLTRTYSNLPAQAIACGLYNVRPINSDLWTKRASTEFYEKVEDIPLIAMVIRVDRENNSMLVSLVDTRGEVDFHINDWLVQRGLAEIGSLENSVDSEARYHEDQEPNLPLITPRSTLPDSATLRPPPGFTKPSEPTNYAAMVDENLCSRNYSYSTTDNSALFNHCNFSVNNNPLPSATPFYNPLSVVTPEALVQFLKQRREMDMHLAAVALNQFLLTNSMTTAAMNSTLNTTIAETPNSTVHQKTNPFQSYQDGELSLTNFSPNLSTSEFDTSDYLNSTTPSQPAEREKNLVNGDSNLLDLDGDIDELSLRLHETNPFRQDLIRRDSSPVETNNNTLKAPPIPPRNPSLINKNVNLATTKIPDVNLSPRIYYTGEPVMYKLNDTDKRRDVETPQFGEPVSSGGNKHHELINSSHETTNHSLSGNTVPERRQDPFTPVREVSTNDAQFLSPRILPSNYRPPPPPYTGNCTEIQYRNKTPISPRYPSPLASEDSRTLIEDIQLPTLDFFEKLESAAPENPGLETRKESVEKHTSSFSTTNIDTSLTTPDLSTFHAENATKPKKEYKIKLIIPKSLQGQESLNNQTKVLSETLGITPRFGEAQDFIKQEQSSSAQKQNDPTHNLHGDGSKDSEEPRGHGNPFEQTKTQQREKSKTEIGNSRVSYNARITRDFDHSGFSTTTRPMHQSPIVSARPYQPQPCYYPSMYPHHLVPQQIHPLPMHFSQRMTLHRPNMPAYCPPPPSWVRPQLYNAAYSHATAYPSQPPLHPNFWSHSPMFSTPQAPSVSHRAGVHEGQQNSDLSRSSSHLADGGVPQNGIEEGDQEATSFVVEANDEKDLQVRESTLSSSEESIMEILDSFIEKVPAVRPVKIFKPIEVNKQVIYLFNIDNQGWVCTDEMVQVFLPSQTRNIVLRLLNMSNVKIDFREVSRAQSPDLFAQLDDSSIRLPRMTNSRRIRGALHLTPIQLLYRMMLALRVISAEDVERSRKQKPLPGSNLAELVKLVKAYKSDDEYWA